MKYLYDTNIFIYYLTGELAVLPLFTETFLSQNTIIISPIIRIELLSFPQLSESETHIIINLLKQFESVPIQPAIEAETIQIKRKYRIKLPDAIIAATALQRSARLVTRNINDFRQISALELCNPFTI